MKIVSDPPGRGVETIHSLAQCTCPDHVLLICMDSHKQVVRKAIRVFGVVPKMHEASCARVKALQAGTPGGDPDLSVTVFGECTHSVDAQAGWVARVVPVQAELSGGRRQFVDAIVRCTNPQASRMVLVEGPDFIATQTVGKIWIVLIMGEVPELPEIHQTQAACPRANP